MEICYYSAIIGAVKQKTNIFEFNDYRLFLKEFYLLRKSLNAKYSYRFFAKAAGYKSASALLDVINGTKNLSLDGIEKFSNALKLTQMEAQYFKALVLLNQAKSLEEKLVFAKEISKLRMNKKIALLDEAQYQLFETWYSTAVVELTTLPDFNEDPQWIANHVVPKITVAQARKALEQLISLGILKRDESGRLQPTESNVTTPDEVSSAYLANWHRQCMKVASESIDTIPREKRDISGVYFSFSQKNLKSVKEIIHKFRRDILELATQETVKDSVYQLNIQMFPVAQSDDRADDRADDSGEEKS